MVELGKATGGGDVPAFEWVVIKEDEDFWVEGIKVSPLNGELPILSLLHSLPDSISRTNSSSVLAQFTTDASSLLHPHPTPLLLLQPSNPHPSSLSTA